MKRNAQPPPVRPTARRRKDRTPPARNVVVIFEMGQRVFRRLRPTLDELIATHDLTCHLRFDGDA